MDPRTFGSPFVAFHPDANRLRRTLLVRTLIARILRRISTMKSLPLSLHFVLTFLAVSALLLPVSLLGQSLTSGDVTGTVLDPSGAAVPNATVTLKNNDTGGTQTTNTTSTGAYRFHLLNPGSYTVSAAASGFQGRAQNVSVAVG
jgi:hypothetical protein